MQRLIFSHYFYSGLTVAVGVFVIGAIAFLLLGMPLAASAAMGAICVSINDVPTPARHKFLETFFGLLLGSTATLSVALARPDPLLLGGAILGVSFVAAMITAYGRKAMPLSFSLFFSMVLTLGVPLETREEALRHGQLFVAGGAVYLIYALAIARVLDFRTRQQALGECLQELAQYMRVQGDFFDPGLDLDQCYRAIIAQQAAVAEKLQTARDLVFRQIRSDRDGMLASTLIAALDLFEHLLSSHIDYTDLRSRYAGSDLLVFFRELSLKGGRHLEDVGYKLMRNEAPGTAVNYKAELFAIEHEIARLRREAQGRPEALAAQAGLVAVYDKTLQGIEQIERLHRAAGTPVTPAQALPVASVEPFLTRPGYRAGLVASHLSLHSPVLRYALRVSLAMACGYGVSLVLPHAAHSYWILLTIAVIMRSSFSATRQRHWDRVIGNLVGCLLAAFLLWATDNPVILLAALFAAIGIAHTFVTLNYRYTSVASCLIGLLPMHFLDPAGHFPIAERLLDTGIGALIAYGFSFVLPSWEYRSIPRLVQDVLKASAAYARSALKAAPDALAYRLARKHMIDAVAALGSASLRMLAEPASQHRAVAPLNQFITDSYLMTAQIASVRILLQHRGRELDMKAVPGLMARTVDEVCRRLGPEAAATAAPPPPLPAPADSGDSGAQGILLRRLAGIEQAAREVRELSRVILQGV